MYAIRSYYAYIEGSSYIENDTVLNGGYLTNNANVWLTVNEGSELSVGTVGKTVNINGNGTVRFKDDCLGANIQTANVIFEGGNIISSDSKFNSSGTAHFNDSYSDITVLETNNSQWQSMIIEKGTVELKPNNTNNPKTFMVNGYLEIKSGAYLKNEASVNVLVKKGQSDSFVNFV